ncbi:MAG: glycosyltransferase [Lachnospiraceae bacterium]|nr:glycosyltransferase [Lachnospiraceae bacterium]
MKPRISIIIWANSTNPIFFRECLLSLLKQDFEDFEIVIVDENTGLEASSVATDLAAGDARVNFYQLKDPKGPAYALNIGLHRRRGDFVFFMGQHDRLSEDALSSFIKEIDKYPTADVLYCDRDELVGVQRMNPAFLPGFNVELLRHMNYIGDAAMFSVRALHRIGTLNTQLQSAAIYDLLLRAAEIGAFVRHVPRLLYHVRLFGDVLPSSKARQLSQRVYREHMTVAATHLQRVGMKCRVTPDGSGEYWRIHYDGTDARSHRSEYKVVHEKGVAVRNSRFVERMYGILRQNDVGIVGVRFEKRLFSIDNCGFIFDEKGLVYPACGNQSTLSTGYLNRSILPQDVSMVDSALFMIDLKVLDHIGGFDRRLHGRSQMLDLCLKVQEAGRRVVFDPGIVARKPHQPKEYENDSSTAILYEKWESTLSEGDPFYNRNLPMGLMNYQLY